MHNNVHSMNNQNPMQTDGFSFVEFAAPNNTEKLKASFMAMGFEEVAKHKQKDILLFRQGQINFLINKEKEGFTAEFAKKHGPSACSMGFQVKNAAFAFDRAQKLGAKVVRNNSLKGILDLPAMYGIGDSLLFFVDQYGQQGDFFADNFTFYSGVDRNPTGLGLELIDHLTHNVYQGNMDTWATFYEKFFNFHEIRYFHITGEQTGLLSRALAAPCGKIRIPINEATEDKSQIAEYLRDYNGEGIQHIALLTNRIVDAVEAIKKKQIDFMTIPDTYYDVIRERFPDLAVDIAPLQKNRILLDGEVDGDKHDILFQIFTETLIGPIFFELIQREGHEGFGEGNFGALFESMERDQKRRGVL